MSPFSPLSSSEEFLAQAEQALKEIDMLFENHGLDPRKVKEYLASITTPEMHAEAQAAVRNEMQEIRQQARELLKPTMRHMPRRSQRMI